jgi:hypothetical protein
MKRTSIVTCAVLLAASGAWCSQAEEPPDREATVRAFVAAFNAHDVEQMIAYVVDDVEWLSIDGRRVVVEAEGKSALKQGMTEYFASCPTCRSELVSVIAAGSRVATLERPTWESRDGPQSQQALAVYEFRESRISRVYYFPSEK